MKSRLFPLFLFGVMLLSLLAGCAQPTAAPAPVTTEQPAAVETEAPPAVEEAPTAEAVVTEAPVTQEKSKVVVWMAGDDARFIRWIQHCERSSKRKILQYDVEIVQLTVGCAP